MRTFLEIQDEVKDLLNFTDAADQDYSTTQLKASINVCYQREVSRGKQHGSKNWFKRVFEYTWTSSTVTMRLPDQLQGKDIISFIDVTDNTTSDRTVEFYPEDQDIVWPTITSGTSSGLCWRDSETLQWGSAGPESDRTLRVTYFADAEEMSADSDEPHLIPAGLRMLLVWSAAVYLRQKADEAAPPEWNNELREARLDYWKILSRGRPHVGNEPVVRPTSY